MKIKTAGMCVPAVSFIITSKTVVHFDYFIQNPSIQVLRPEEEVPACRTG